MPTPPEVWLDFDPDAGDFKEEILSEKTENGVYNKEAYISAYVNGVEVRVYCKYSVKAGAKKAPGLMNVHGWMGAPAIDKAKILDLPVAGAKTLTLIVTDGDNGAGGDHASWADAYLTAKK